MEIICTEEQVKEFLDDEFIEITIGNHRIYAELDREKNFWYFEMVKSNNGKTLQGYAYDITELEKLKSKRPNYYHNDPLCPNCGTYMIYQFEHCPKCGQKTDWSEK